MRCNGIDCPNYDKCPINHEPVEGIGLSCDDWYECDDLVSFYLKMKEIEAKALKFSSSTLGDKKK